VLFRSNIEPFTLKNKILTFTCRLHRKYYMLFAVFAKSEIHLLSDLQFSILESIKVQSKSTVFIR